MAARTVSWPAYVTNLRARLRCPVLLLVVCADARTAAWCATPIELGPGSVVTPWVLGPDRLPVVTEADVLEEQMAIGTYEYQSEFARSYFSQGEAQGEAKGEVDALLEVLAARGITVNDDARSQIIQCADVKQLKNWIRRAATATSIDDLFD